MFAKNDKLRTVREPGRNPADPRVILKLHAHHAKAGGSNCFALSACTEEKHFLKITVLFTELPASSLKPVDVHEKVPIVSDQSMRTEQCRCKQK